MQVVVECHLRTSLNITKCKESNADISIDHPLLSFTVGAAAVVYEPRRVSFRPSVNHTILCESEHVEIGHMVFMSFFDSLLTLLCVNHLPNILSHKVPLFESLVGLETPATTFCLKHLSLCVQAFGETLVFTAVTRRTHLWMALIL